MSKQHLRQGRYLILLALPALMTAALTGCSQGNSEASGGGSPSPSSGTTSPSFVPETIPDPVEVAPGVQRPSNAIDPSRMPEDLLLNGEQAQEAALAAQGIASQLLFVQSLFAPREGPVTPSLLQFVDGLSAMALDKYYSWLVDKPSMNKNFRNITGLVFVPPQDAGKRGYAIPPVQEQQFSDVSILEGPPSQIDGAPTTKVTFKISGTLMWKDEKGFVWLAPLSRDISYIIARQNDSWVLDDWDPSQVVIGEPRKANERESKGISFSDLEPPEYSPDLFAVPLDDILKP